jgi:hypothetical protein
MEGGLGEALALSKPFQRRSYRSPTRRVAFPVVIAAQALIHSRGAGRIVTAGPRPGAKPSSLHPMDPDLRQDDAITGFLVIDIMALPKPPPLCHRLAHDRCDRS